MTTIIKSDTALVNFEDWAGDTITIAFNFADSDNVDIDFTGSTVDLIVKSKPDQAALLTLSSPDDVQLNTVTDSNVYATITAAQTTELGAGSYYYWLVLTDSLSEVNTLAAGLIILRAR